MKLSNYKHLQRIYVYDSIQLIKSYSEKRIVSIGELLNDYNGLTIFYSLEKIKEKVRKNPNTTYVQYNFGSDWQPQIGNQCLWFLTTDYSDNQTYTPLNSWQGVYRLIDDKKGQYFQRYSAPSDTDIAAQVTLVNMEKKLSWE